MAGSGAAGFAVSAGAGASNETRSCYARSVRSATRAAPRERVAVAEFAAFFEDQALIRRAD